MVDKPEFKPAKIVLSLEVHQEELGDGTSQYTFPWTVTWTDGTQTPVRQIGTEINKLAEVFAQRVAAEFEEYGKRIGRKHIPK